MKKLILAVAVALSLAGCAQLQDFGSIVSAATKSYANPVTRADLDKAEAGLQAVFVALKTYKTACVQGLADANCKDNIRTIQVYTRQVPAMLTQIRAFVDAGDQINATTLYNSLVALVATIRQTAISRGVTING